MDSRVGQTSAAVLKVSGMVSAQEWVAHRSAVSAEQHAKVHMPLPSSLLRAGAGATCSAHQIAYVASAGAQSRGLTQSPAMCRPHSARQLRSSLSSEVTAHTAQAGQRRWSSHHGQDPAQRAQELDVHIKPCQMLGAHASIGLAGPRPWTLQSPESRAALVHSRGPLLSVLGAHDPITLAGSRP